MRSCILVTITRLDILKAETCKLPRNILVTTIDVASYTVTTSGCAAHFMKLVTSHLSSPVTGLEWPRGFQEVKVKQSRYRPRVAQRVPGS